MNLFQPTNSRSEHESGKEKNMEHKMKDLEPLVD